VTIGKFVVTTIKVFAAGVVYALCFAIGAALSGLGKAAQQVTPSPTTLQTSHPLSLLLICSFSVGVVLAYLILRSSWHGWLLTGAIFAGMYGISTVAPQVETLFFLSNKLPRGIIRAIFLQGAITAALFSPVAVFLLGKWQTPSPTRTIASLDRLNTASVARRLAVIVVAFVFLYMFFGYYVAWQDPAVRQYYGGPEQPSFFAALKANWIYNPWIYPLQIFRALLYAACMYPLIRMLRVARWERAFAMVLFLSVWTTILLLPNPLIPRDVAFAHFRETLGFSIVFGAIAGWLLSNAPNPVAGVTAS